MAPPSPKNICLLMAALFLFNIYWIGLPAPGVQGQNLFNNLLDGKLGDLNKLLSGAQEFIDIDSRIRAEGGGGGGGGP